MTLPQRLDTFICFLCTSKTNLPFMYSAGLTGVGYRATKCKIFTDCLHHATLCALKLQTSRPKKLLRHSLHGEWLKWIKQVKVLYFIIDVLSSYSKKMPPKPVIGLSGLWLILAIITCYNHHTYKNFILTFVSKTVFCQMDGSFLITTALFSRSSVVCPLLWKIR